MPLGDYVQFYLNLNKAGYVCTCVCPHHTPWPNGHQCFFFKLKKLFLYYIFLIKKISGFFNFIFVAKVVINPYEDIDEGKAGIISLGKYLATSGYRSKIK